ncbi:MAG: hypothetical protein AAF674_02510 [Pseudomonadota bacterium]
MTLRHFVFAVLAAPLLGLIPEQAQSCTLVPEHGGGIGGSIESLQPGTFTGRVECEATSHALAIWTISVDGSAEALGVRDDPLFRVRTANPLTQVAAIGYDQNIQFSLFRRAMEQPENATRLFATVCDTGDDPLNCSLGQQRVKLRIDLRDTDDDGVVDHAYNQISVYDGASKLQVVYVDLPTDAQPHRLVGAWLRFFSETGVLKLER